MRRSRSLGTIKCLWYCSPAFPSSGLQRTPKETNGEHFSTMGAGPPKAVENAIPPEVEIDCSADSIKISRGEEMGKIKQRVESLYHKISAMMNLKCPRCYLVFDGYGGCNALKCRKPDCGATFCAICLEDCDNDANIHVLSRHGRLDDSEAFYRGKQARELATLENFIEEIKHEPFEVKELLRIKYEKSLPKSSRSGGGAAIDAAFVESARNSIGEALRHGRTSLLKGRAGPHGFEIDDVSPRNAIPKDYRLRLQSKSDNSLVCRITLEKFTDGEWTVIPLPDDKEKEGSSQQSEQPKVDALINVRGSLQCGVIAFRGERQLYQTRTVSSKGKLDSNEVSVVFHAVANKGSLVGEKLTLPAICCNERDVLGLNQNRRIMMLNRHIQETDLSELLFDPLRHYIGSETPQRVFSDITVPVQDTFKELNREQQRVAHPLALTTAMEVAGPPGTGKTKTITELVRSILECTDHHVIVLSERNGAIDAIADKFADDCVDRNPRNEPKSVKNVRLWNCLMAFGSVGSMGSSTKLFTVDGKLSYHPDLVEPRRILAEKQQAYIKLKTSMLTELAEMIDGSQGVLPEGAEPWKRRRLVLSGIEAGLESGRAIVASVTRAHRAIHDILPKHNSELHEEKVDDVVNAHSSILGHLLPIRPPEEARSTRAWNMCKKEVQLALVQIHAGLDSLLLESNTFSLKNAQEAELAVFQAEKILNAAIECAKKELVENARVLLSTIGSSHRLPGGEAKAAGKGLSGAFGRMSVSGTQKKRKSIVVFDEAGCIPSYEFLGLSMLGRSINSLVCVGDKNQLPPYDPGSNSTNRYTSHGAESLQEGVKSLLDVSQLKPDKGKIKLTTQYRVPRDIANLLNCRIYQGDYQTAPECRAPLRGFHFVHIPGPVEEYSRKKGRKKYDRKSEINQDEIQCCLELVLQSKKDGHESIMVLTPYKKQQRELQFKFRKNNCKDVPVLTIDQCQGKEADIVAISMVKKPTRFLNKNRLIVALSRVRRKLYFVADENKFQKASQNSDWDCSQIAKDLLQLAASREGVILI